MTSGSLKMQDNPQVPHVVLTAELRFDRQSNSYAKQHGTNLMQP